MNKVVKVSLAVAVFAGLAVVAWGQNKEIVVKQATEKRPTDATQFAAKSTSASADDLTDDTFLAKPVAAAADSRKYASGSAGGPTSS